MNIPWEKEDDYEVAWVGGFILFAFKNHFEVFYAGHPKEYYFDGTENAYETTSDVVEEDHSMYYEDNISREHENKPPIKNLEDGKAAAEKWFQEHIDAVSVFKDRE